ncbi:hypothetical protein RJT34_16367 [Clitoria ternatea]|uniref:Uncharacterized protein n=1 Tax=Clitoria ternatea TaxID=43366 RepID=A0AAN9J721_CLITE
MVTSRLGTKGIMFRLCFHSVKGSFDRWFLLVFTVGNSKTKHIIEQLLMKASFSRDKCDRLIKIIKSSCRSCKCW